MKAICFRSVETVALEQIPDPEIESPTDAIVRVRVAGLCGSDLHVYFGREQGIEIPTALGHEFVGEVVAVGSEVSAIRVGQIVGAPFTSNCGTCFYCRNGLTARCEQGELFGWRQEGRGLHGGQAEYVRVPLADHTLMPTDGLNPTLALLLGDNLSTGFYATDLADVRPEGTYVVVGCGTVGLITIFAAVQRGVTNLFAIDLVEHRLKLAEHLGATPISEPDQAVEIVRAATGGRGADGVMELVGLPAAQKLAFELLRPGGTLATIGCHCEQTFAFSPIHAYDKNLTYRSGRCPARHYMEQLKQPALEGDFDRLIPLVSHRYSIDDAVEAYRVFSGRADHCIKAVLSV